MIYRIFNDRNQFGFSLVELAIVLMISGFTMLAVAKSVNIYTLNLQRDKTLEHIKITQAALREFYGLYGRYPCPAAPTLPPDDADYGKEQCRSIADLATNPDDCTGNPANIECIDNPAGTLRDGDNNGVEDVITIGIIPFATISGLEGVVDTKYRSYHRLDGFSINLSYAVTEHMTDRVKHSTTRPANPNSGGIRVEDENEVSVTYPENSVHYVIYSHGDNKIGGYSSDGGLVENCFVPAIVYGGAPDDDDVVAAPGPRAGTAGIKAEIESCDNNDGIFVKGIRSLADNDSYYDDVLFYGVTAHTDLWKVSFATPEGESWIYNTNLGNVGVGTEEPTHKLHIVGDIRTDASTMGQSYCDGVSTDCLLPSAIAGTGSGCAPNEVAYGIQNNQIECRPVEWSIPTDRVCPQLDGSETFMRGVSNIGNVLCCTVAGNNCCKYDGAVCTPI